MFDMAGDDAVQFGLGEPDFQPPDIAIEAFSKAMKDGHNKYTRSEEHTSELQSRRNLVCRLLLEKKKSKHGLLSC